ncbi:hypothetical protein [Saccharomonospora iraqiensis]|uniref:hypothetical protein n=1 Tax=Saccharomonospora iraqiensis TaxID=52698 RepID=UPI0004091871|nr:hypothetical protein [Saccharomonospora iraqiensis]
MDGEALAHDPRVPVPHLGEGGRIINIGSSNADRTPFPDQSVSALTKGALAASPEHSHRAGSPSTTSNPDRSTPTHR